MKNIFENLGDNLKHYLFSNSQFLSDENKKTINQAFISNSENQSESITTDGYNLAGYSKSVFNRYEQLERNRFCLKLWSKDAEIFKQSSESKAITGFMGWLTSPEEMKEYLEEIYDFAQDVNEAGFKKVILLGMGGSSLAPFVFHQAYGHLKQGLSLEVLDTTDPQTIEAVEYSSPLENTLFIVASKSGATAEVTALFEYFYTKVYERKGEKAGKNFIAITDPGTPLVKLAHKLNFRKTFLNFVDIGGRYSALSYFGLVPAALVGADIQEFLERSDSMVRSCGPDIPVIQNEGVRLGATLGELAKQGRNKLTLLVPRKLSSLTLWIEQLVAESTGKNGTGILPVEGFPLGDPNNYGNDRVFVKIHLGDEPDSHADTLKELSIAGHPVIHLRMNDGYDLGAHMYLWEIATTTIGSVLEVNPFDQPNVQENKEVTNSLLRDLENSGYIADEDFQTQDNNLKFFSKIKQSKNGNLLEKLFSKAHTGDFISIQAYLPENAQTQKVLNEMKSFIENWLGVATTIGFGPRFLHSTGQFHKGGPNKGLFLQITTDHATDIDLPGRGYTFGGLNLAQALGDYKTLCKYDRNVLRVHLKGDMMESLNYLQKKVEESQTEYVMNMNHTE